MDLTNNFPRSAYDMNAGVVILPRTTDKANAFNAETIGEYHYGCPLDQSLFDFLGTNKDEFLAKVKELETDEKIAEWVESFGKGQEEKDSFNNERRHSKPEDEGSKKWLQEQKEALGREDINTYFENLDADEKRY